MKPISGQTAPSEICARGLAIIAVISLAAFLPAAPVKSGVIGSLHDINNNGCKSCHAPHNGSAALGGTDQGTGKVLLWDRAFPGGTFGVYDSPTMDQKAQEVGGLPLLNTQVRMYTLLCMSCHDGVTTLDVMQGSSINAIGNPSNSHGLTNDHPVNILWRHQTGGSCMKCHTLHGGNILKGTLPFYGSSVQCATCHDPHSPANANFLRIDNNTGSALCLYCHG